MKRPLGASAMNTTTTQTEEGTTTINDLRKQLAELEAKRIASLPKAEPEQIAALLDLTRSVREETTAKEIGLNERFRLTPVQRATLAVARAEHIEFINKPEVRKQAADTVLGAAELVTYKVRAGKGGLTFKIAGRL